MNSNHVLYARVTIGSPIVANFAVGDIIAYVHFSNNEPFLLRVFNRQIFYID